MSAAGVLTAGGRRASEPGLRRATPVVALTALAALLRFPTLDLQSFWFDETVTVVDVLKPTLAATLAAVPSQELAPPLYPALAWAWSELFGTGEVGLRSLSALIGTATVPVTYRAAAELVSRRVAVVTGGLVAVSPLLVSYSQEARGYALLVLLGALSFLFFVRALDGAGARSLTWWALSSALALLTHYFAVFLVVPEGVWLLLALRRRRIAASAAAGAVLAIGLALLPLALTQRGTGGADWIGRIPLGRRLLDMPEKFLAGLPSAENPTWPLAALAAGVGVGLLLTRGEERERRRAAVAAAMAGLTLLVPLALTLAGADYFYFRHLMVATVPLLITVAAGMGVRRAGRLGLAAAGVLGALGLALNLAAVMMPKLQRDDWRSAAVALGPPREPRAVALTSYAREPLMAYGHRVVSMPAHGVRVREIALLGATRPGPPPAPPVPGFEPVERRQIQKLTLVRFRSPRARPVTEAQLVDALGLFPHAVVYEPAARRP